MSAQKLITDHLDLWTGAITKKSTSGRGSNGKIELTGIKKLRELILELAIRGSLTEQRTVESDASEIVAKLADEQKQLVSAGLIKKPKPLKPLNEGEKPYLLPKGWEWVRLGQTMEMYNGRAFKASEWSTSGIPIVRIQNLNDPTSPTNFFSGQLDDRHAIDTGTFLISWSGTPGTSFGAFIWNRGPAALNQHINKCVFFGNHLSTEFMRLAVNGQMKNFIQNAQGGVGLKHVTKGVLSNALIALPPLEEQHRIVQKVDELMALCDRLEQQTSDQLDAHETLVDTLLSTLTQSENAAELAENWARLSAHFDTLFTTEQSIDKLKQTILQLAVMGRLVEQNFSSEDSSLLLQKIESKRAQLVQQGKLKGNNKQCISEKINTPFNLPANWSWVRISDLLPEFQNGASSRGDRSGSEVIVLRLADITNLEIILNDPRRLLISNSSISKYAVREGDILIIRVNGSADLVGRFIPVEEPFDGIFCDHFIRMRTDSEIIDPRFFALAGSTNLVRSRIEDLFVSTAGQKTVNQKHIGSLLAPLPPIEEQHRIVQKVDELMALCDQLKERLNQAGETRCQLAKAVVEGALQA